ncbi:sulfite exporter TauE/SafE family protein [Ectobacillus polymachus]|uniref:sulfite exporter TauE/SafE family protein n=1 Tax=Ectobacillus polymachus TaxID=1508806 RepID=UPI003A857B84
MAVEIIITMFAVGLLLGFVGAGGSGFIISILVLFGIPIHIALGTALVAMIFSSLSGAVSHYLEENVSLKQGIVVGIFGAIGAWISSKFSVFMPADQLKWMTASMLYLSGIVLWLRMFIISRKQSIDDSSTPMTGILFFVSACGIGFITGALSGLFGIGSTPFIQIGLMAILGMSVRKSAGTTMLVIILIAIAGGTGYYHLGYLNLQLLSEVVIGTMLGSYIGAKFTKRAPAAFLKTSMVLFPMMGGTLLLI